LLLSPCASTSGRIVHLFHRREPDRFAALAHLATAGRGEKKTQQEDSMKYLFVIVAAMTLIGTASATSRLADCCGGGVCCLVKSSCCAN
jgi:hypothetical protein